ncbi:carbohydrate kinase [Streptococcus danieliae]|nr:carbohydrate kinase [Streptococcus danieliae]
MNYYLCIDYGGTATKAIVFDEQGQEVSSSSFETKRQEVESGFYEVDLGESWQAIARAIGESLRLADLPASAIQAVACIGHGKGLYLLDQEQREFYPGILSADSRASDLAQAFENRVGEIWELTRQHVVAPQAPVLLRWLKDHRPDVYQQVGAVLAAKDYVRFKLTGLVYQERGDASGNHWINFQTGAYDPAISTFFGIEEMAAVLPPLVDYQQIVGGVSQEAALQTGLLEGTPVLGGLFDIDACALGSGVLDSETFSLVAGTWNINTYPSGKPADLDSGLMNSLFPTGEYLVEASSPTSAGNLDAVLKLLMREEMILLKERGESIYETLEVFLAETDATFSKILFCPFLYGSNVGQPAEACFWGLTTQSTKSEMIRAVYEGIVFAHKQHLEQLIHSLGRAPQVLRLSGGATNSDTWMQMFADILEIPVEVPQAKELGGLGGAIACHQAVTGVSLQEAVQQMVTIDKRFNPCPNSYYLKKYQVYRRLLAAMESVWQDLLALRRAEL